jgi:hypothetical protein
LKETAATITEHLSHGGGAVAEDGGTILGVIFWNEEDGGLQ